MNSESLISIYHSAFIICAAFAVMFLVISIVLFFVFKIPQTFNSITGRARKRAIEEMSQRNASTGRMLPRTHIPGDTSSSLSLSTKLVNIRNNTTLMTQDPSIGLNASASVPAYRQEAQNNAPPELPTKSTISADMDNDQTMLLDPSKAPNTYRQESAKPEPVRSEPVRSQPVKPYAEHTELNAPKPELADKIADTSKSDAPKVDIKNNSVVGISSSPVEFDIGMGETIRLSPDMLNMASQKVEIGKFDIIDEKMLIHTDEDIE